VGIATVGRSIAPFGFDGISLNIYATIPPVLKFKSRRRTRRRPYRLREENHMSNQKSAPAQQPKAEQPHPYRPLALKAVVAAALMLKPKQALKPAG
jgi:hypothetical protein